MKRSIIILVVLVLVAATAFIYFTKDEVVFTKETSLYKAIPVSSPVFVEVKSFKSIPVDNPILNELSAIQEVRFFQNWMEKTDTLVRANKAIQNGILSDPFIIAFDFVGEEKLFPLIIAKAENNAKKRSLSLLFEMLYPENTFNKEEKSYSKNKMVCLISADGKQTFYYSLLSGLILASPKEILVEEAIRQLNSGSLMENSNFSRLNKTVTNHPKMAWFINHSTFPDLLELWFNGKSVQSVNEFGETLKVNYRNSMAAFSKYAAWTELDTEFDSDKMALNGMSISNDSLNHFLSLFEGQEPVRSKADEVLPKNTSYFTSYSFSNKMLFFEKLEKYFSHTGNYYKREDRIKKIESAFRSNFKTVFQGFVKNEIIVATTVVPPNPENKTTLFLIPTEGKTNAESQFVNLLSVYAQRKKVELASLKSVYSVDNETKFTIYRFPYPSAPGIWLDKPFGVAKANYAAFFDNTLVFCNTEKGIRDYLHNLVLGASLSKDLHFVNFKQNWSNRSNINSFVNINRIFSFNKEIFSRNLVKNIDKNAADLRKVQAMVWQVSSEEKMFFNSFILSFNQSLEEEAQTTWQSNIGGKIITKPQFTINQSDPENREVMVQDDQFKLYQVSKEGRVRWSVAIDEPILSKIHQIDYFRNGRLQYLFNTKTKLFILDRNGNNVAHFPVTLRSSATNGVSVFDYDNNRKYRYFIACENKKIYAYDASGKIVSGWVFGQTDHVVSTPIQHFRVQNKDYIVFKDKSRVYIQNRRGETRIKTTVQFECSNNPVFLNLTGTPKMVLSDKSGKVYYFYFNGKVAEKKVGNFSENHFFSVADINGNGVPDFVFIDGKELTVVDENGKKLFNKKFKNNIQHNANIYSFGAKNKKIGVVDEKGNRIYLYDKSGKLHEGFPLHGNSEFSIGKIEKSAPTLNLIVGSKGGDLYNYTLN